MKVNFDKYTDKDDFAIMITPSIAVGKENSSWFIGFAWCCFVINISF